MEGITMQTSEAPGKFACLLLLSLVLSIFAISPALADGYQYPSNTYAIVNNPNPEDRLNLRADPTTEADSWGKYYNGSYVLLKSEPVPGWVYVQIGDALGYACGYMQKKYLELNPAQSSMASAMPIMTIRNARGQGLHLRSDKTTDSASLGLFLNGTQVMVMGYTNEWYHVQIGGKTGFISKSGFDTNPPSTQTPPNQGSTPPPAGHFSAETTKELGIGYTVMAEVTEGNKGQFFATVHLKFNDFLANDTITSFNLYMNGTTYLGFVSPMGWVNNNPDACPIYFEYAFDYSGRIQQISLRPVWDEGGEIADRDDYIWLDNGGQGGEI